MSEVIQLPAAGENLGTKIEDMATGTIISD